MILWKSISEKFLIKCMKDEMIITQKPRHLEKHNFNLPGFFVNNRRRTSTATDTGGTIAIRSIKSR